MLRKQIVPRRSSEPVPFENEISVADVATVQVTSEEADHPIDNAFDHNRGPGGSRWIAAEPGEQTLILLFDRPQTIRKIGLEVEDLAVTRTQELSVSVSSDGGRTYRELVRQEFTLEELFLRITAQAQTQPHEPVPAAMSAGASVERAP